MANTTEKIATFVLMDLETTGLYSVGETPRIVEMSFVAVCRKHLLENKRGECPRIQDKLALCVNPCGKPMTCGASFITGIYNDVLEDLAAFDDRVVQMLTLFLSRLPQPVCMLAHNGLKFDFPMLKMELERLGLGLPISLLCADTLEAFRVLDPSGEGSSGRSLNGECQLATSSTKNHSTVKVSAASLNTPSSAFQKAQGSNICFKDEITPVKSDDEDAVCFANPPPAPRKKRNLPGGARNVGNMKSAKRRLLQDETGTDQNRLNSGGFHLGTCAASPPPSPQVPSRSLARRKLAFNDAPTNGSGEATPANCQAAETEHDDDDKSDENCDELLKFPDDFSDDEMAEVDIEFSSSLPDEDLISAVDELEAKRAVGKCTALQIGSSVSASSSQIENNGFKQESSGMQLHVAALSETQPKATCNTPISQNGKNNLASEVYSGQATPTRPDQSEANSDGNLTKNDKDRTNQIIANLHNNNDNQNIPTNIPGTSSSTSGHTSGSTRKSFKLIDIYKRVFGHAPQVSHAAEDDCLSLLKIIATCATSFGAWVDENAIPFVDVKKMY